MDPYPRDRVGGGAAGGAPGRDAAGDGGCGGTICTSMEPIWIALPMSSFAAGRGDGALG
jgi:hypothetical protein